LQVVACLLAAAADRRANAAVFVVVSVAVALLRAGDARGRARLKERTHDSGIRRGLAHDRASRGFARVGAVGTESGDSDHLPGVVLAQAGVRARGTARTAVQTLFDTTDEQAAVDRSRMRMQPDNVLKAVFGRSSFSLTSSRTAVIRSSVVMPFSPPPM